MGNILKVTLSTFVSLFSLFTLTKMTGNRQMSQLSMFDYVSSVALGSIAGEMAVLSTGSIIEPLVSMIIFAASSFCISYVTCKSIFLRRILEGHALILYQNGQIYEKNLLKAKIDLNEMLAECRLLGYFDLEEIHTIYLENKGKLSILPLPDSRPLTAKDVQLNPDTSYPLANIIIDGKLMKNNLKYTGKNEAWVNKQLSNKGIPDMKEVILATFDQNKDELNIYMRYNKKLLTDIFG